MIFLNGKRKILVHFVFIWHWLFYYSMLLLLLLLLLKHILDHFKCQNQKEIITFTFYFVFKPEITYLCCVYSSLFFFGSLSCVTITIQSDWAKSSLWKLHLCLSQSGSLPSPWWNHMLLWYGFLVHLLFPRDVDILCKFMFKIYSLKRNSYAALQSWILTNLSLVLEFWGCYQMAFLAVGLAPLQIFIPHFSFSSF